MFPALSGAAQMKKELVVASLGGFAKSLNKYSSFIISASKEKKQANSLAQYVKFS